MLNKIRVNGNKNINHNLIKAKLGITNKKKHTIFYMEGGMFLMPSCEYDDYELIMNKIKNKCKIYLKNKLSNNDFLSNDFLINFDICANRMSLNKKTLFSFQYHFKQKNNLNYDIISIKENHEEFFKNLLNDMQENLINYNFKIIKK